MIGIVTNQVGEKMENLFEIGIVVFLIVLLLTIPMQLFF